MQSPNAGSGLKIFLHFLSHLALMCSLNLKVAKADTGYSSPSQDVLGGVSPASEGMPLFSNPAAIPYRTFGTAFIQYGASPYGRKFFQNYQSVSGNNSKDPNQAINSITQFLNKEILLEAGLGTAYNFSNGFAIGMSHSAHAEALVIGEITPIIQSSQVFMSQFYAGARRDFFSRRLALGLTVIPYYLLELYLNDDIFYVVTEKQALQIQKSGIENFGLTTILGAIWTESWQAQKFELGFKLRNLPTKTFGATAWVNKKNTKTNEDLDGQATLFTSYHFPIIPSLSVSSEFGYAKELIAEDVHTDFGDLSWSMHFTKYFDLYVGTPHSSPAIGAGCQIFGWRISYSNTADQRPNGDNNPKLRIHRFLFAATF